MIIVGEHGPELTEIPAGCEVVRVTHLPQCDGFFGGRCEDDCPMKSLRGNDGA